MDAGDGAKKRMIDEMGFSSGTDAIADDKKQRLEEDSQFSADKIEKMDALDGAHYFIRLSPMKLGPHLQFPDSHYNLMQTDVGDVVKKSMADAPATGGDNSSELAVNGLPSAESDAPGAGELPCVEPAAPGAGVVPDAPASGGDDSSELEVNGLPSAESGAPGAGGEASSECELEGYGSLGEDDVDIDCSSQPQSPTRDLQSAKEVNIPRAVFEQLKIKWGGGQRQVLEAIVTSNDESACLIVSCILYDKLKH